MSQPVSSTALTPKKNLRGTMTLFLSIVIGIFLFLLVAIAFGQSRGALMPDLNRHHTLLTVGMVVLSSVCLFFSRQLFAKAVEGLKNSGDVLNERLNLHRAALLKYLVLCEIPVMLSIIVFLLTGNFVFQVYAGIFIGFMLTMMPTRKRVAEQLGLGSQEQQALA